METKTKTEPPKVEPAFSEEELSKMSPIDREFAEMMMQDFPGITAKEILAAIEAA